MQFTISSRTKKIICRTFLLLSAVFPCAAARADEPRLELVAHHPAEVIPCMPVEIRLTVVNRSREKVVLKNFPPSETGIFVRITRSDTAREHFDGIAGGSELHRLEAEIPAEIEPDGYESFFIHLKGGWKEREGERAPMRPLFDQPGVYSISFRHRCAFSPARGDGEDAGLGDSTHALLLETQPREIRVKDMADGGFARAWTALGGLSNAILLLEPQYVLSGYWEPDSLRQWDRELETFLSAHGESPWSPLAWLARARIAGRLAYVIPEERTPGRSRHRRNMLQNMVGYAELAARSASLHRIDYIRRKALAARALGLSELGERDTTAAFRDRLRAEEWMRTSLDRYEARAYYQDVRNRLQARGYDPDGLMEYAPAAWMEYRRIQHRHWQRYSDGEITIREYYAIRASALVHLTLTHMRPVSREELQRRIRLREEAVEQRIRK